MSLEAFVEAYGYWAVLIGAFLEGETIVALGGFAAQLGYLELPGVVAVAFAGSLAGDQLYYYIGRRYGDRLLRSRLSWQASIDRVYALLSRHQNLLILTFRFYYGLRSVTPFAIGAAGIPRLRFFVLNAIGALVWAIVVGTAGFLLGQALRALIADFRRYQLYILAVLAILALAVWIASLVYRRRKARLRGGGGA